MTFIVRNCMENTFVAVKSTVADSPCFQIVTVRPVPEWSGFQIVLDGNEV